MTFDIERRFTIERFEAGHIDPEQFSHKAHVYVAWLYVTTYEIDTALRKFDSALRRLTAGLGMPEKYHATITGFLVMRIAARAGKDESWPAFCEANADLIENGKALLALHYSKACLNSAEARRQFVQPDRIAA